MIDIFTGTGAPLTGVAWKKAISALGARVDEALVWSILAVETRGFGYLPDRRPKILYERHIFHNRTGGKFSAAHPDVSNPDRGGYEGGVAEYGRLKRAMLLDRRAALESASWGLGQVMGFNAAGIGYGSVEVMIEAFKRGEDDQLEACVKFVTTRQALHEAVKDRNWARVAFFYNGMSYAANGYDKKLASTYDNYSKGSLPDIEVRAAQARLSYLGFNPQGIDVVLGPRTKAALRAFQSAYRGRRLSVTGDLDQETKTALESETAIAAGV